MGARRLVLAERVILGLVLVGEVATLAFCLVVRPTPASVIAPVLGPWSGHLYGHASCTLATTVPVASWTLLACLLFTGSGVALARETRARAFTVATFGLVLLAWCVATFLSVVNTLE